MMLSSADIVDARKRAASPAIIESKKGSSQTKRARDLFLTSRRNSTTPPPQQSSTSAPRSRPSSTNPSNYDNSSRFNKSVHSLTSVHKLNKGSPTESNSNLNANPYNAPNQSFNRSRAVSINNHYSSQNSTFDTPKFKSLQTAKMSRSTSSPNVSERPVNGLSFIDRTLNIFLPKKNDVQSRPELIDVLSPTKKDSAENSYISSDNSIQESVPEGDLNKHRKEHRLSNHSKIIESPQLLYPNHNLQSSLPVLFYGENDNGNSTMTNQRIPTLNPDTQLRNVANQESPINQPSLFNETLMSTASPSHLNRSYTVIKYKNVGSSNNTPINSGLNPVNAEYDERLTGELSYNEAQNIEDLLDEYSPRRHNTISSPSKSLMSKARAIPRRSNSHKIYKNGILNSISPLTASPNSPLGFGVADSQVSCSSILHPIRNPNDIVKSNSFFTEASFNVKTPSPGIESNNANSIAVSNSFLARKSEENYKKEDVIQNFSNQSSAFSNEAPDPDPEDALNDKSFRLLKKTTRKSKIIIGLLSTLIILLVLGFVPSMVILARGTADSVSNYFASATPETRENMLTGLIQQYNVSLLSKEDDFDASFPVHTKLSEKRRTTNPKKPVVLKKVAQEISQDVKKKGAMLGGVNTFEGLNSKYKSDSDVERLMGDPRFNGTVFYGIGYAPQNVIYPVCGADFRDIVLDLALVSKVTTRVRSYGMQCNQANLILDAIMDLGLNMTLSMGVWIGSDETINKEQMDAMKATMKSYPRKLFETILIGNEVKFREDQTSEGLSKYISAAKEFAISLGWDDLPIGTSEIGSKVDEQLVSSSDIIGANVHPFFSGDNVKIATEWTLNFMKYQVEPVKTNAELNDTEFTISEVGWPYNGGTYIDAVAGPKHLQYFMDNWVCEAYKTDYAWYWFEAFDEPWKQIYHEEGKKWETEWGLFTSERKFKEGITFPNCH